MAAYAHSRGMQPREALQALVNSMEKTLRKEKGENLAGQTSSLNASQREEAAGKSEVKSNPGRGGRDLEKERRRTTVLHAAKIREGGFPRRPDGKKSRKKKPRAETVKAGRHKAKRTRQWLSQARRKPSLCLRQGAASPGVSWKRSGRAWRAQRGKAPRCRWRASVGCPENLLMREWLCV